MLNDNGLFKGKKIVLEDHPPLNRARNRYQQLDDLLRNLPKKLSEVTANVDKEFLSSYRVHMLSIQSEIKQLKLDVTKGVEALNNDGSVAKLETEVNWFVDECNRLQVQYASMSRDSQQMEARLDALKEQEAYLNEHLKSVMKKNRVLQAEIDYAESFQPQEVLTKYLKSQNTIKSKPTKEKEIRDSPLKSLSKTAPVFRNLGPSESQPLLTATDHHVLNSQRNIDLSRSAPLLPSNISMNLYSAPNSPTAGRRALSPLLSNPYRMNNNHSSSRVNSPSAMSQRFRGGSRGGSRMGSRGGSISPGALSPSAGRSGMDYTSLESSANFSTLHASRPNTGQSSSRMLDSVQQQREMLSDLVSQRTITELELELSIGEIFEEVRARRAQQAKLTSTKPMQGRSRPGSATPSVEESELKNTYRVGITDVPLYNKMGTIKLTNPAIVDVGGIGGTGLEQFTDNDKFSTVVKFLLNFEQFKLVSEGLRDYAGGGR